MGNIECSENIGPLLPTEEKVRSWILSPNGKDVLETLGYIDLCRHRMAHPPEQMPIPDIRHAAYVGEINELIFSRPAEWLHYRSQTVERRLHRIDPTRYGYHYIVGTTARIPENGWYIFEAKDYRVDSPDIQACKRGLARQGYLLLLRGKNTYIPVFPD